MRYVFYTDKSGKIRRTLVRNEDGDEMAEFGLPAGPPDVDQLDWEQIKVQINNVLVDAGAFDIIALQRTGVLEPIGNIVKRYIMSLYREDSRLARAPTAISKQE